MTAKKLSLTETFAMWGEHLNERQATQLLEELLNADGVRCEHGWIDPHNTQEMTNAWHAWRGCPGSPILNKLQQEND